MNRPSEARLDESRHDVGGHRLTFYIPPLELHLLLAGLTIAIALGAFGVTIRGWALMWTPPPGSAAELQPLELPEHRLRPDVPNRPPHVDPTPGAPSIPQV